MQEMGILSQKKFKKSIIVTIKILTHESTNYQNSEIKVQK